MNAPKRGSAELKRQREWHGWAFRNYTEDQKNAIRHYIKTGEITEHLPK